MKFETINVALANTLAGTSIVAVLLPISQAVAIIAGLGSILITINTLIINYSKYQEGWRKVLYNAILYREKLKEKFKYNGKTKN